MYLLNKTRQLTEDAKGELNDPTQNSTVSHISKIKVCTIHDYYLIKTGKRLFSSTVHASQSTQVKSRYASDKNILRTY